MLPIARCNGRRMFRDSDSLSQRPVDCPLAAQCARYSDHAEEADELIFPVPTDNLERCDLLIEK